MATDPTSQEVAALAHWSTYGQPGEPPSKRVTASDWKIKPFRRATTATWNVDVKPSDLSILLNGFLPRAMEDKWFIYADEPDSSGHAHLHFFRSWTGIKIAEIVLQTRKVDGKTTDGESAQITDILWELDEENVMVQDEQDVKRMVREVCRWVLNVELPADESDLG